MLFRKAAENFKKKLRKVKAIYKEDCKVLRGDKNDVIQIQRNLNLVASIVPHDTSGDEQDIYLNLSIIAVSFKFDLDPNILVMSKVKFKTFHLNGL